MEESAGVRDRVRGFILSRFLFTSDEGAIGDDDSFLATGIVDSTGVLEILAFLEEEFLLSVADEEVTPENLDSVSRICDFVGRKEAADPVPAGVSP